GDGRDVVLRLDGRGGATHVRARGWAHREYVVDRRADGEPWAVELRGGEGRDRRFLEVGGAGAGEVQHYGQCSLSRLHRDGDGDQPYGGRSEGAGRQDPAGRF